MYALAGIQWRESAAHRLRVRLRYLVSFLGYGLRVGPGRNSLTLMSNPPSISLLLPGLLSLLVMGLSYSLVIVMAVVVMVIAIRPHAGIAAVEVTVLAICA